MTEPLLIEPQHNQTEFVLVQIGTRKQMSREQTGQIKRQTKTSGVISATRRPESRRTAHAQQQPAENGLLFGAEPV